MKSLFVVLVLLLFSINSREEVRFLGARYPHSEKDAATPSDYKLAPHPRLFFSKGEEKEVLKKAKQNALLAQLLDVLRKEADKTLKVAPQEYIAGKELLQVSREQISRIVPLALSYRLFGDIRYARKVEEELLNVCKFNSWNPQHFLDVAEMTTAVAIGYDWCYDYLSPTTRKVAEDAIRSKAFAPAWPVYADTARTFFSRENNWNMVCNSGMLTGAIAIGDKYPKDLYRIVDYAVKYTPNLLESFAPDGVFNEGPGYWSYNGIYMALFFDNLRRNIGKDFGLCDFKGLSNTARFYMSIIGPSKQVFNYGDAPLHIDYSPTFFYLSRHYQQPEIAEFYRSLIQYAFDQNKADETFKFPRFFFLNIPWFDDSPHTTRSVPQKLETFNGVTDLIIINGNSKDDIDRLYLAAKTGRANWSHNHLDVGSFIVECEGVRWGIDVGAEKYSLPSFWDYKPGGVRWSYFRNSNLSHNTLAIDNQIALSDGQGELIKTNNDTPTPYGIFDLSAPYQDRAASVLRGFKLIAEDVILIRDEIQPLPGSKTVSWKFFTKAKVELDGNTAKLSEEGKNFYIRCLPGFGLSMGVKEPPSLSDAEKPLSGVRYIEIVAPLSDKKQAISVLMTNHPEKFEGAAVENKPLKNW